MLLGWLAHRAVSSTLGLFLPSAPADLERGRAAPLFLPLVGLVSCTVGMGGARFFPGGATQLLQASQDTPQSATGGGGG
jgi:hypothetical protein